MLEGLGACGVGCVAGGRGRPDAVGCGKQGSGWGWLMNLITSARDAASAAMGLLTAAGVDLGLEGSACLAVFRTLWGVALCTSLKAVCVESAIEPRMWRGEPLCCHTLSSTHKHPLRFSPRTRRRQSWGTDAGASDFCVCPPPQVSAIRGSDAQGEIAEEHGWSGMMAGLERRMLAGI